MTSASAGAIPWVLCPLIGVEHPRGDDTVSHPSVKESEEVQMSNTPVAMSVDEWSDLYLPIVNHFDANASFDDGNGGIMFET